MLSKLSEIATITMGLSPKGETYNHKGEGLPLLNGPTEFGNIYPNCMLYTTDTKRNCQKGDLLFCVRGSTTGRMNWADQVYSLGRGVCSIRGIDKYATLYIRYALDLYLKALLNYSGGSTFPNLNKDDIENFSIPFSKNYKEITAILSAYDELIENNNRRIVLLEKAAEEIYREWFVRMRFPGWETTYFEKGVPVGWEEKKISQVCDKITSGGTPRTSEPSYWNGGIPWLSSGETKNGFIVKTDKTITEIAVASSSTRLAKSGSIVIASAGQGNTRGQTSMLLIDSYVNQSVLNLSAELVSNYYLFFNISNRYEELRLTSDSFSSRGSLTTKLIGQLYILVPQQDVVAEFDEIVEPITKKIKNLTIKNSYLRRKHDLLLSRLISGKLPVEDLEIRFPPRMMETEKPVHA